MIEVVILGNGRTAHFLISQFIACNQIKIKQWYMRQPKGDESQFLIETTTALTSVIKNADIYFICISDDAIASFSKSLTVSGLVVHTAGSIPLQILNDHQQKGVFYPLQTLSKNALPQIDRVPICIEAEKKDDFDLLTRLASLINAKYYSVDSTQRATLHLAAVFANNFSNHLYAISADLCKKNQLPFEILHPLIIETAQKLQTLPPKEAQTGPAIRNDHQTLKKHLKQLSTTPYMELYESLTQSIQKYHEEKL